ncbi:MAG: Riboflavin synthase eubacterial/eukaryotic, partial [uncultured Pseudonocardia sp.]
VHRHRGGDGRGARRARGRRGGGVHRAGPHRDVRRGPRRLDRRQRRVPHRDRPRRRHRRHVPRRTGARDAPAHEPGRRDGGHGGQPGAGDGRGRAPRRAHRAGPRGRHRRPALARPGRALRRVAVLPEPRPRPVRGGEGVDHRGRGVAHRGRSGLRLLLGCPHPDDVGAHHTRDPSSRGYRQHRGRRRCQVRRTAHGRVPVV